MANKKKKHIADQFELPFNKPVKANIEVGKLPSIVTRGEIAGLCMPKGDGAIDAFERGLSDLLNEDNMTYWDDGFGY